MKRYVGVIVGVVVAIVAGVMVSSRSSERQRASARELAFTQLQRDYLERVGWIRVHPDEKGYKDEVNPFFRAYFKDVDALLAKYDGNKEFDDYLKKLEERAAAGKERKGSGDPKAHYDYVRAVFDRMRKGEYEPTWSATDKGMRLDVFAQDHASGGTPQVRLATVLWGAQRAAKEDGKAKKMVTSASYDVKWKFTDDKGKLVAEMNAQDPSMKIDYPELFIAEFPPMMVLGHYDMDLLPADVAKAEITFTVRSRAATGGEAEGVYTWKLDVPREWRLQPGQAWQGATESERAPEEIDPTASGKVR